MTDRIKAIRARHQAIAAREAVADQQTADVAYLLDEVTRLLAIKRVPPRDHRCPTCSNCLVMEHQRKRADKAEAKVQRVEAALDQQWYDASDLYDAVSAALMEAAS